MIEQAKNRRARGQVWNEGEKVPGFRVMLESQANSVFLEMALVALARRPGWHFFTFIGSEGARFMCSWDTEVEEIAALARDIRIATAG